MAAIFSLMGTKNSSISVINWTIYEWNHDNNGTKYVCNLDSKSDWKCLQIMQSQIQNGLFMLEIFFSRDHICLQCWKWSQNHVTMIFGRISRKTFFNDCKHIWFLLEDIASINIPFWILDCKIIKSPF